MRENYWLGEG